MSGSRKPRNSKSKVKACHASMTADVELPLSGFRSTEIPDATCLKLVYSDFRTITSTVNQGEYVYRINSCFDCDFTGVGGQPDGFDQWKTLYTRYRVVACEVEVQACGFTGIGFIAIAPTIASTSLASAEEAAGLRHAQGGVFTLGQGYVTKLKRLWRMSQISGVSDQTVLADNEYAALVGANPTQSQYLHVCTETAGASDVVEVWTKLTYYVRFEAADYTLDTAALHRNRFRLAAAGGPVRAKKDDDKRGAITCGASTATQLDRLRDLTDSLARASSLLANLSSPNTGSAPAVSLADGCVVSSAAVLKQT